MAIFSNAILPLLKREGFDKITDVSGDFGGLTKFGISKKAYPDVDIRNLTMTDAAAIYKRDYWDCVGGDKIVEASVAENIFDAAVNHGVTRAILLAQKSAASPKVKVDGIMGPVSIEFINKLTINTPEDYVRLFNLNRLRFYSDIVTKDKSQLKFLHGWLNRALEMSNV